MANHHVPKDAYEYNIFATRAVRITRELTKMARIACRRGYGTTQLIFSDWSFVSRTDSGLMREVEVLLRAGHKPLGFIAPERDRKRTPFVEAWDTGDSAALAELRNLAHSTYWHLLPVRNAQTDSAIQEQ
jgi:hypothetical protein